MALQEFNSSPSIIFKLPAKASICDHIYKYLMTWSIYQKKEQKKHIPVCMLLVDMQWLMLLLIFWVIFVDGKKLIVHIFFENFT